MQSVSPFNVFGVRIQPTETGTVAPDYWSSVQQLASVTDTLPPGWQAPYGRAMLALEAVNAPRREVLIVSGPFFDTGTVRFEVDRPDPVVEGLLRKTAARLNSSCWCCGRPARQRRLGLALMPLCAACYAPRALRAEVNLLLHPYLSGAATPFFSLYPFRDFSARLRQIIPSSCWRHVRAEDNTFSTRLLTGDDLLKLAPSLVAFKDHLTALTGHGPAAP